MRKLLTAIFTLSLGTCFGQTGVDLANEANLLSFLSNYEAAFESKDAMLLQSLNRIYDSSSIPNYVQNENLKKLKKYNLNSTAYIEHIKPEWQRYYNSSTNSYDRGYSAHQYNSIIKHLDLKSNIYNSKLGTGEKSIINSYYSKIKNAQFNLSNAFDEGSIPYNFKHHDQKYGRMYQESLSMNDLIMNLFILAEEDLASQYLYFHALANLEDHRKEWQQNAWVEMARKFCNEEVTDVKSSGKLLDSDKEDLIYLSSCQTRLHFAIIPKLYIDTDSLDIAAKKLNAGIEEVNSHISSIYYAILNGVRNGKNHLSSRIQKSSAYINLLSSYTALAKTKHGSLLLSRKAQEFGLRILSPKQMIDHVNKQQAHNFFLPSVTRDQVKELAEASEQAMIEIKGDLDSLINRATISLNSIATTHDPHTISSHYEYYLQYVDRLVKIYPHITGKLISKNMDLYSFLALRALDRISAQGRSQYLFNKTIKWGSIIAGTGLMITGVGSGIGAALIGSGTATGATLAGVATASFTAGTAVGVASAGYHINEAHKSYREMKDYSRSALSGNDYAIRNYDAAVQRFYTARTAAAIELGFIAADLGALKIFGKIFSGKDAVKDINNAAEGFERIGKGSAAPSLTDISDLDARVIRKSLDDSDKWRHVPHSASQYAEHLTQQLKQVEGKIIAKNVEYIGTKNRVKELERLQQSILDIQGKTGHYLGYQVQKDGSLIIIAHRAPSPNGNFNINAMKAYLTDFWQNFKQAFPPKRKAIYQRKFGSKHPEDIFKDLVYLQDQAYKNVQRKVKDGHYKFWRGDKFEIDHIEYLAEYNFLILNYFEDISHYVYHMKKYAEAAKVMKSLKAEKAKIIDQIVAIDPTFVSPNFR